MKGITNLIITEFAMKDMDWMGYKLQKGDQFTYHHNLLLKSEGGLYTRENAAILAGKTSHPYVHLIQYKNIECYMYLRTLLAQINEQGHMPTYQQLMAIDGVLLHFENEHSWDKNSKGKLLIKKEYKERIQCKMR